MEAVLLAKKQEASGVLTFMFAPTVTLSWIAGQSIKIEMPVGMYDIEERRFTISSAPHEGFIAITTRITKSSFKQKLLALKEGDKVQLSTIEGDFTWKENDKPHTFIAGGIGITPFYAMLKDRLHTKQSLNAHLIYNGEESISPFLQQLKYVQQGSIFRLTFTDKRLQRDDIKNTTGGYIYISGPASMVTTTQDLLLDELCIPPHLIKTDQFTGYKQGLTP